MTEQGAQPYEDLGAWLTDDLFPGWARYWNDADAAPPLFETPKPPWFRNTRVLVGVIAAAASTLVVAGAALVALNNSAFPQTSPLRSISTATPAPVPNSSVRVPAPVVEPAPAEAVTGPTGDPDPADDLRPSAAVDPPAPRLTVPDRSDDPPRTNVTRTPMSFAPVTGN
jgi:hypothetical protein